jgi:mono/diheme cytochrome c family protein
MRICLPFTRLCLDLPVQDVMKKSCNAKMRGVFQMNGKLIGLALLVSVVAAGLGWTMWPEGEPGLLPYRDAAVTALGRDIYAENCASCHGADLRGQPNWRAQDADGYMPAPPQDQTGHTWHHPDAQLIEITRLGTEAMVGGNYRSRMAGFKDILSEDEIIAALAYIKSTWPTQVIDQHNRINKDAAIVN